LKERFENDYAMTPNDSSFYTSSYPNTWCSHTLAMLVYVSGTLFFIIIILILLP